MQHYSLKAFHDTEGMSNWAKVVKLNWIGSLGIGRIIDFFHRAGMVFELIDKLNSLAKTSESCSLLAFNTLPLRLSGPLAFLMLSLYNSL